MIKNLLILALLFVAVTFLGIFTFRWRHTDYFFLREVCRQPQAEHRARLLEIAAKGRENQQRFTAINTMLAEALMLLGRAEDDAGLRQQAADILRKQVDLNPGDLGVLQAYAEALAVNGQSEEADKIFRRLLDTLRAHNVRLKEGQS